MAAYATREQLEVAFSAADIKMWADRNNNRNEAEITAAITDALDTATDYVNDAIRGGPYTVPFTNVPRTIMDLCRKRAGCELYGARGAQDTDENGQPIDRLSGIREMVDRRLAAIKAGLIQLDAERADAVPFVVPQTLHREEDLA